jgi:hypothetical protein
VLQQLRSTAAAQLRACARPFGYLAFAIALAALSASARLLGSEHELGYFAGRLDQMIRCHPEVVRQGKHMTWVAWAALLGLAVSPLDPIPSWWDEVLLAALGAASIWRRTVGGRRVGH